VPITYFRNFPQFAQVVVGTNNGRSYYDSLQVSLRKAVGALQFAANYTWAKSLDDLPPRAGVTGFDTSSALPWDDPHRHQFDYGPSEFDHKHRFVASYVWQLPSLKNMNSLVRGFLGDWQLSGVVQAQTGRPITVVQGAEISRTGIGQDRGTFTGANPYASGDCAKVAPCVLYLNKSAFKDTMDPTILNTFGNVGKGSLRYPGSFGWDMGLSKTFSITERLKVQLRGEYFNIFNNVNFLSDEGTVNNSSTYTNSNFGTLQVAADPRIGQVALKIIF
jgi:hypothetical protein